MAILSINEMPGGRASGQLETGNRDYTRKYQVITDDPAESALAAASADGLPRLGDAYAANGDFDSTALCRSVDAQQDDENPRVWDVTCEYGAPSADSAQTNPNPVLRPAVLSFGFVQSSQAVFRDTHGQGILNSAGEYFNPCPEIVTSYPTLTITRNFFAFNSALAVQYQDAVNSDAFLGNAPGVARIAGISAVSQTEANFFYWQVSVEIHFRREGWQLRILDQGRNKLVDGVRVPIWQRDEAGQNFVGMVVAEPQKLRNGQPIWNSNPADCEFLPFEVYPSLPFAALQII